MPFDELGFGEDARRILQHQDQMQTARSVFESHWQEIAEFVMPRAAEFTRVWTQGAKRTWRQFDAFSTLALSRFAAAMEGGLIPRASTWHHLTTGDDELDEMREVREYMEEVNRILHRMRYSVNANFASQAHEMFMSLGAFGTAVMWCPLNEQRSGLLYKTVHLAEMFIAEDQHGRPHIAHRKFESNPIKMAKRFGYDKLPPRAVTALDNGDYEMKFQLLHAVRPNEEWDRMSLGFNGMPFTETWLSMDDEHVLERGGYETMPYLISRHVTSPTETYGRSPAMQMLPDIKMANEVARITIDAANLQIDPPWLLAHQDVLGQFSARPGARNYGGIDEGGNQLVLPLISGAKPELGMEMLQRIHSGIDDAFLGVYFRTLLENPQMTATQALLVAQQQGQMAQPVIGRQQTEWLGPMLRREAQVAAESGKLPTPPRALVRHIEDSGEPLGIRYESPLARQAQQEEAIAILRTFEQMAPILEAMPPEERPEMIRKFDFDKISERLARLNGMPAELFKSEEEIERLSQAQGEMASQQSLLEAAPVAASAAKTLAEAQQTAASVPGGLGAPAPGLPALPVS